MPVFGWHSQNRSGAAGKPKKPWHSPIGHNPRYRGKRSYNPLLCIEAKSSYLWDTELRPGNAGTWEGSVELMATCFVNVPPDIREVRVRADAGFGFNPVLEILEARPSQE